MSKKIPNRKCIACGEMKEKHELVRVVKSKDGDIAVDLNNKMNGRGCYVCKNENCIAAAKKGRRIERSFATKVSDDIYDALEKVIKSE